VNDRKIPENWKGRKTKQVKNSRINKFICFLLHVLVLRFSPWRAAALQGEYKTYPPCDSCWYFSSACKFPSESPSFQNMSCQNWVQFVQSFLRNNARLRPSKNAPSWYVGALRVRIGRRSVEIHIRWSARIRGRTASKLEMVKPQ